MMPEWHQLDASSTMTQQQELTKKKILKSSSRSFWFSTGLFVPFDCSDIEHVHPIFCAHLIIFLGVLNLDISTCSFSVAK